jgi:hypothetical protein
MYAPPPPPSPWAPHKTLPLGAAQNVATLARLGIAPKNVTFTTVAPLQGSGAAMDKGSSVNYEGDQRTVGLKAYFDNLLDAHSAEQFFGGPRAKIPTQKPSLSASIAKGGASMGIGLATGHLLAQLGVDNPYVNASLSGAVGSASTDALQNVSRAALFKLGSKYGAKVTATELASGALRSGTEGGILGLVTLPLDQGLNLLYRKSGMDATAAGALSGATSTAIVGIGGIGTSVAAGEMAFGPEMIPVALLTLLFTGIAAGLGAAGGADEEAQRQQASDTVDAQFRLIQALQGHDFDVDAARASLSQKDQDLIQDDFVATVNNVLDGKPSTSTMATAAQLTAQRDAELAEPYRGGFRQMEKRDQRINNRYNPQIQQAQRVERMQALSTKLIQAHMQSVVTGQAFANPLTNAERNELQGLDPDYARRAEVYANMFHSRQVEQATHIRETERNIVERVQQGEQVDLTDDEQQILSLDQGFAQRLQNAMKPQIDQENADQLGVSVDDYYKMAANVHNGMDAEQAYQSATKKQTSVTEQSIVDDAITPSFAKQVVELQRTARDAGYYTIDEYAYRDRMVEWTPQASQIMRAHEMGLTEHEYVDFMQEVALGNEDAYEVVKGMYTPAEVAKQRQTDDARYDAEVRASQGPGRTLVPVAQDGQRDTTGEK